MKLRRYSFTDALADAENYDITVRITPGFIDFYPPDADTAIASMRRLPRTGKAYASASSAFTWRGFTTRSDGTKTTVEGLKGSVANWCVDVAANGPL